jgi:fluoride exporter
MSAALSTTRALAAIAVGAIAGAWLRYGLAVWFNRSPSIPLGTLAANLIGALSIGLALGYFTHEGVVERISPAWRLAIVTGFLGALTTFSTFSAEVVENLQQGRMVSALTLSALHFFGSLALTAIGFAVMRVVLKLH